jgi:hypothetical protein
MHFGSEVTHQGFQVSDIRRTAPPFDFRRYFLHGFRTEDTGSAFERVRSIGSSDGVLFIGGTLDFLQALDSGRLQFIQERFGELHISKTSSHE